MLKKYLGQATSKEIILSSDICKLSLNEIHHKGSIAQSNIIGSNFLGDGRAEPEERLVGVPDC